jgi:DDE superfamily endonuclease
MALAVEGRRVRSLQRFLRATGWDEEQRRGPSPQRVAEEGGEPEGVGRFAEAGFVTKGKDAAGGARHYGGTRGTGAPWQGGVGAGDASRQGAGLVDPRLCVPAVWLSPAEASRRAPGRGPEARRFQTPPPWAAALLQRLRQAARRPCRYSVAESVAGHSPHCRAALEAWGGATALGARSSETRCGRQRSAPPAPA